MVNGGLHGEWEFCIRQSVSVLPNSPVIREQAKLLLPINIHSFTYVGAHTYQRTYLTFGGCLGIVLTPNSKP